MRRKAGLRRGSPDYDGHMELADQRFLITGGAGFLGRAVQSKLMGAGVTEMIVPRRAEYDLTRPDDVEKLFADAAPDVVIHMAAQVGGIGANMKNPAVLYLNNLLMGTYVIEEARKRDVMKTVVLGTICSYPKFTPVPFREESLWDGYPEETNAPYGIAKKALLVHAQSNRAQYGQNSIYLLPVNLYGPGDKFHPSVSHVIPALIKKFVDAVDSSAPTVEVWGSGTATREFLYVDDAAEGIVAGTESYDGADPVNLGSGREISIKELAEVIASLSGFEGELVWDASKPDGQPRRQLDTSKAKELFGFEAKTALEDGLRTTIDWYRSHREEAEAARL
ncbi:MAG: GDP-L-fucose synthase [Actinomycetota bacterium]|nr:GDP-L-fucose synthase [Actinomycetota bacterium]